MSELSANAERIWDIDRLRRIASDVTRGFRQTHVWRQLAMDDIRGRYRRTVLGPFWLVVTQAFWILAIALVFSQIFGQQVGDFMLFVSVGLATWSFILSSVVDAPHLFLRSRNYLEAYAIPFSVHIPRFVLTNLIVYAHHLLIFVACLVLIRNTLSVVSLLALPGLLINITAATGAALLLGTLGIRYRDLHPALQTLMNFAFVLTPVFWDRSHIVKYQFIADFNPFFHFIEIIRRPLLGSAPDALSWVLTSAIALALVAAGLYSYYRGRGTMIALL